jgi:D-beta-D-heptose 7-phosphate kinase/D-beta-D-heptose 1-phosphate adenosyltransferase
MVLVPSPQSGIKNPIALPAIAREVYDVSGAGDTVVALMTLGLAAKAPMLETMHIANTGAALVVGKWGTQPIQMHELELALRERPEPGLPTFTTQGKLINKESLRSLIKEPHARHKKVVFTNGCFDILHAGHVTYLEKAKSLGDVLVVAVNTDESVARLKGPERPFVKLEDRLRMLAALAAVDYVVAFSESEPKDLIAYLAPDVLVKGADYDPEAPAGSPRAISGAEAVKTQGGRVVAIPLVDGLSTTNLIKKIKGT